jgi:hypothetical protein
VHGPARQCCVIGRGGDGVLVGEFGAQQLGLLRPEVGQHQGSGLVPPGEAAQIGLVAIEAAPHEVQARERLAHGRAVLRAGRELALAGQPVDEGRGLAAHAVHDVALRVGTRVGHGQATLREVLHQVQVKRQLLWPQALEQREHEFARAAGDEVVGVFYTADDALQRQQFAELQAL